MIVIVCEEVNIGRDGWTNSDTVNVPSIHIWLIKITNDIGGNGGNGRGFTPMKYVYRSSSGGGNGVYVGLYSEENGKPKTYINGAYVSSNVVDVNQEIIISGMNEVILNGTYYLGIGTNGFGFNVYSYKPGGEPLVYVNHDPSGALSKFPNDISPGDVNNYGTVDGEMMLYLIANYVNYCGGIDQYDTDNVCNGRGDCVGSNNCTCNSGYTGDTCEYVICYEYSSEDSGNVCSGNGQCSTPNNCSCNDGYTHEECQNPICYTFTSNDTANVCSNHGFCSSPNNCSCDSGYYGDVCSDWDCYSIVKSSSAVCNYLNGSCSSPNNCSCNLNYYGDECDEWNCYSISKDNSSVCSTYGSCILPNSCLCDDGYIDSQCQNWNCYDVIMSNSSYVCSNHGSCLNPNNCSCEIGYLENDCSSWNCYNIVKTDSSVCNYLNGSCLSPNNCSCNLNYSGNECNEWYCFTINKDDISVCSSYGDCVLPNTCVCNSGYYEAQCQNWNCYEVKMNNSSFVCNNHGSCLSPNNCSCDDGYYGNECNVWDCYTILNTDLSVCNHQNGSCESPDNCSCNANYYGNSCQNFDCYNINKDNSSVCSSLGLCTLPNICSCFDSYYGNQCQQWNCWNILMSNLSVCNGHGSCSSQDNCSCESNYFGSDCSSWRCYDILKNDIAVCSNSNGTCISSNNCSCNNNYYGNQCDDWDCFNINKDDPSVCSNQGTCINPNYCSCSAGYDEERCNYPICFGVSSNNTNVCSSNGICNSPDYCFCEDQFYGDDCSIEEFFCFNISSLDTNKVCSGNGICISNACNCSYGFVGVDCTVFNGSHNCYGKSNTDPSVCSSRGTCISNNNCSCFNNEKGEKCEKNVCFAESDPLYQCSSSGECISNDKCKCNDGYFGESCEIVECYGTLSNDSGVCNSSGLCLGFDYCLCSVNGYIEDCTVTKCFGIRSNDDNVCSSRGKCMLPNMCSCDDQTYGVNCEYDICYETISTDVNSCSSHGECKLGRCICEDGYFGQKCDVATCWGIMSNISTVCSNHGDCVEKDICECFSSNETGYYGGSNCSLSSCNKVLDCSSNGRCNDLGLCECYENFKGLNCSECNVDYYGKKCLSWISSSFNISKDLRYLIGELFVEDRTSDSINCSALFDSNSIEKIGSKSVCIWKGSLLYVYLNEADYENLLTLNINLFPLSENSLYVEVDVTFPIEMEGLDVTFPIEMEGLYAYIKSPSTIGRCNDLILDGSNSRGITFSWSLLNEVSDDTHRDLKLLLNSTNNPVVNIPHLFLKPMMIYQFRLIVLLGSYESSPYVKAVEKLGVSFPVAKIEGPETQLVDSTKFIIVQGGVKRSPAECGMEENVYYFWRQTSGPSFDFLETKNNRLLIPPHTLHPSATYEFEFSVFSEPNIVSTASVTLNVLSSPLSCYIFGGTTITVSSMLNNLTLTAFVTDPLEVGEIVKFYWNCRDLDNGFCSDSNNEILGDFGNSNQINVIIKNSLNISTYNFSVIAAKGDRYVSCYQLIVIDDNDIPMAAIEILSSPNADRLILSGVLFSQDDDYNFLWFLNGDLLIEEYSFTPTDQSLIGINSNKLNPGQEYTFSLCLVYNGSIYERASLSVEKEMTPFNGKCLITPNNGSVLQTTFTVSCFNWIDENYADSLTYSFSYFNPIVEKDVFVETGSLKNSITFVLPVSGEIVVKYWVENKIGMKVEGEILVNVYVEESFGGIEDIALDYIEQSILSNGEDREKVINSMTNVITILMSADDDIFPEKTEVVVLKVLDLLSSTLFTDIPSTEKSIDQQTTLLSMISKVIVNCSSEIVSNNLLLAVENIKLENPDVVTKHSLEKLIEVLSDVEEIFPFFKDNSQRIYSASQTFAKDFLFQKLVVGEESTIIQSNKLSIGITKESYNHFNGEFKFSDVTITYPREIYGNNHGVLSVSSVIYFNNPYHYFSSSENVSSSVVSLDFYMDNELLIVDNLTDPIYYELQGNYNLTMLNLNNQSSGGYIPFCSYFQNDVWIKGCEFLNISENKMMCNCYHATDYAGVVEYMLPELNILTWEDVKNIRKLNRYNIATLIVLSIMLLLYFFCLIAFRLSNYYRKFSKKTLVRTFSKQYVYFQLRVQKSILRKFVRDLLEEHDWTAIFQKFSKESAYFSRSQRVTVLMIIILSNFAATALTWSKESVNVIQFLVTCLITDVLGNMAAFIFKFAFLNVKPPEKCCEEDEEDEKYSEENKEEDYSENESFFQKAKDNSFKMLSPPLKKKLTRRFSDIFSPKTPTTFSKDQFQKGFHSFNLNYRKDPGDIGVEEKPKMSKKVYEKYKKEESKWYDRIIDRIDKAIEAVIKFIRDLVKTFYVFGVIAIIVISIVYFAVIFSLCGLTYFYISWIGPIGTYYFVSLSLILYVLVLEYFYIVSKISKHTKIMEEMKKESSKSRAKENWDDLKNAVVWNSKRSIMFQLTYTVLLILPILVILIAGCVVLCFYFKDYFDIITAIIFLLCGLIVCDVIWIIFIFKKPSGIGEKFIPHWFLPIVYFFSWAYMIGCSFVLVLYGIKFDDTPGKTWLVSVSVESCQDVFLIQPIKIVVKVLIVTFLLDIFEVLFFNVKMNKGNRAELVSDDETSLPNTPRNVVSPTSPFSTPSQKENIFRHDKPKQSTDNNDVLKKDFSIKMKKKKSKKMKWKKFKEKNKIQIEKVQIPLRPVYFDN